MEKGFCVFVGENISGLLTNGYKYYYIRSEVGYYLVKHPTIGENDYIALIFYDYQFDKNFKKMDLIREEKINSILND